MTSLFNYVVINLQDQKPVNSDHLGAIKSKQTVCYYVTRTQLDNWEEIILLKSHFSFEPDVVLCSVSVIPLQHRSCSVCMSFVRLCHHNG